MRIASTLLLAGCCTPWLGVQAQNPPEHAKNLAPYVPSPPKIVERMLDAARIKPGETVFDLGCGDGRILITAAEKYEAKAVGVELSEKLVESAKKNIQERGLEARVKVIHGDLLDADLTGADVVFLYLLTSSNDRLRPNLEKYLKPGARVISHDYKIRGWKPARVETVPAHRRNHTIYVYQMPPEK